MCVHVFKPVGGWNEAGVAWMFRARTSRAVRYISLCQIPVEVQESKAWRRTAQVDLGPDLAEKEELRGSG